MAKNKQKAENKGFMNAQKDEIDNQKMIE